MKVTGALCCLGKHSFHLPAFSSSFSPFSHIFLTSSPICLSLIFHFVPFLLFPVSPSRSFLFICASSFSAFTPSPVFSSCHPIIFSPLPLLCPPYCSLPLPRFLCPIFSNRLSSLLSSCTPPSSPSFPCFSNLFLIFTVPPPFLSCTVHSYLVSLRLLPSFFPAVPCGVAITSAAVD